MSGHELALWLILGIVTLLATTSVVLPLRGGHGQHAHAGPGTLTVDYLRGERVVLAVRVPKRRVHHEPTPDDEDIVWPTERDRQRQEPTELTPLERDLARLCARPDGEYVGRHRLDEPYELHEPPRPLELVTA